MVEPGIVADDELTIACQSDVKLKAIHSMLKGEIKGSKGILGRVCARATMSQQKDAPGQKKESPNQDRCRG